MPSDSFRDLRVTQRDGVAIITLARPHKRNALSDGVMAELAQAFAELPSSTRAAVIHGDGEHFCAGLDLSELSERDAVEGMHHSRGWHSILSGIEFGRIPVVVAIHGACVGGGLELAATCHIRVADETAYFALPEGSRGIFVGGGGSVRIPKLIGTQHMMDMMLTGRIHRADVAVAMGFAQYLVPSGQALERAVEIATRIAQNAPMTNYSLMQGLPRIAEQASDHGYFTEGLLAAIAQSAPEAKARVREFLEGRGPKVKVSQS